MTVTAEVPDEAAKTSLLEEVTKTAGPGVSVVDEITVKDGATAPSAAAVNALLPGGKGVKGFSATWAPDTLTLTGDAADEKTKGLAATAAQTAVKGWEPQPKIDNQMKVAAVAPTPTPSANAACAGIGQKVAAITTKTRILFAENSPKLTPASQTALGQVAQLLKGCGTAKAVVAGNTDNQGSDATSKPLSQKRADSVKSMLVGAGVKAANISTVANGSAKPIAPNNTDAGRTANRRVDITVK